MSEPKRVLLKSKSLPLSLRLQIWAGKKIYGGKSSRENGLGGGGQVFFLPCHRVVKLRCHPSELEAMEFIRTNTTIPIPKVFEAYEYNGQQHLVMERIPSDPRWWRTMTPDQVKTFGKELAGIIQQLRNLKPPAEGFIGSLSLGANLDHRLSGTRFGPFYNIADFHTYLRFGRPLEQWGNKPDVIKVHSQPEVYTVKFTHADLHPNNIAVKDGHITGIIDWEFAGWYPEYWEYTKMYFGELRPNWDRFYEAVEGDPGIEKYPDEKASELAIWMRMSPWSYDDPQWKPGDDERGLEEEPAREEVES